MTADTGWISVPRITAPTVWLATPDGLVSIDLIAIELAMNGRRTGWTLTPDEARYAGRIMLDREVPYSTISARIGVGTDRLREWFPGEIEPSNERMARSGPRPKPSQITEQCGTRRGYRRHRANLEAPCVLCTEGHKVADRHYREHGTYIGAPQITAGAL